MNEIQQEGFFNAKLYEMTFRKSMLFCICIVLTQLTFAQGHKSFQWIGGPTYVLQLGSFRILTDPMLCRKGDTAFIIKQQPTTGQTNAPIKRFAEPAPFDTAGIDVLLISHTHADHVDKEARNYLSRSLTAIAPSTESQGMIDWGFVNTTGLEWGSTVTYNKADESLRITAVQARHAVGDALNTALGKVNGYIIEHNDGHAVYRIYWTGDNVWFDEMQNLTKYGKIDLLIPDMGAVGSDGKIGRRGLNSGDCLRIITLLDPGTVIPVHHTTFSMYVEPISVLRETLDTTAYKDRLRLPQPGSIIEL
jgi:N-acyl-phosphatidylethanolamine-hydrolysing phospholipase D